MLQINNLKLIHDKDYRVLIDGLSFTVNPGDKIVIIGEKDEGKSTLIKPMFAVTFWHHNSSTSFLVI